MNAPLDTDSIVAVATSSAAIVHRARAASRVAEHDELAEETPVALEYNGIAHATMLATPSDLEDFAYGFSLTEGIVGSPADILDSYIEPRANGIVAHIEIAVECEARLKDQRRMLAGRTGCGLCGKVSLEHVVRDIGPVRYAPIVRLAAIHRVARQMRERQALHRMTGATHAAGWALANGELLEVREDVGRHNALDKLVGALVRREAGMSQGFVLVSSRASYEMVQKAAAAGIAVLAAVSAPTALAVRLAKDAGVTLIGFLRGDECVIYSHAERVAA